MNLAKLFETQAGLDAHIFEQHPELQGQDNLDWKILALQVELGECANEWRGFKKWSKDQEARTFEPNINAPCKACDGQGYKDKHLDIKQWIFCKECDGIGVHYYNPLLEEYVDCLHFILSIGLEIGCTPVACDVALKTRNEDITNQFLYILDEPMKIKHNLSYKDTTNFAEQTVFGNYHRLLGMFKGLGEMLGFTWDEIEAAYYDKNKINHERQDGGY